MCQQTKKNIVLVPTAHFTMGLQVNARLVHYWTKKMPLVIGKNT